MIRMRVSIPAAALLLAVSFTATPGSAKAKKKKTEKAKEVPAAPASPGDESLDPFGEAAKLSDKSLEEGAPPDVLGGDPFTPAGDMEPDPVDLPHMEGLDTGLGIKAAMDLSAEMGAELSGAALPKATAEEKKKAHKKAKVVAHDGRETKRKALADKPVKAAGPRYGMQEIDPTLPAPVATTVETVAPAAVAGALASGGTGLTAREDGSAVAAPAEAAEPVSAAHGRHRQVARDQGVFAMAVAAGQQEKAPAPVAQSATMPTLAVAGGTAPSAAQGSLTGAAMGRIDGGPAYADERTEAPKGMIGGVPTAAVADTFAVPAADGAVATATPAYAAPERTAPALDAGAVLADADEGNRAPIQDREDDYASALFGADRANRKDTSDGHDGAAAVVGATTFAGAGSTAADEPMVPAPRPPKTVTVAHAAQAQSAAAVPAAPHSQAQQVAAHAPQAQSAAAVPAAPHSQAQQVATNAPQAQSAAAVPAAPHSQAQQVAAHAPQTQSATAVPAAPHSQAQQVATNAPQAQSAAAVQAAPHSQAQQVAAHAPQTQSATAVPAAPHSQAQQVATNAPQAQSAAAVQAAPHSQAQQVPQSTPTEQVASNAPQPPRQDYSKMTGQAVSGAAVARPMTFVDDTSVAAQIPYAVGRAPNADLDAQRQAPEQGDAKVLAALADNSPVKPAAGVQAAPAGPAYKPTGETDEEPRAKPVAAEADRAYDPKLLDVFTQAKDTPAAVSARKAAPTASAAAVQAAPHSQTQQVAAHAPQTQSAAAVQAAPHSQAQQVPQSTPIEQVASNAPQPPRQDYSKMTGQAVSGAAVARPMTFVDDTSVAAQIPYAVGRAPNADLDAQRQAPEQGDAKVLAALADNSPVKPAAGVQAAPAGPAYKPTGEMDDEPRAKPDTAEADRAYDPKLLDVFTKAQDPVSAAAHKTTTGSTRTAQAKPAPIKAHPTASAGKAKAVLAAGAARAKTTSAAKRPKSAGAFAAHAAADVHAASVAGAIVPEPVGGSRSVVILLAMVCGLSAAAGGALLLRRRR